MSVARRVAVLCLWGILVGLVALTAYAALSDGALVFRGLIALGMGAPIILMFISMLNRGQRSRDGTASPTSIQELPVTPALATAVAARRRRSRRLLALVTIGAIGGLSALGLVLSTVTGDETPAIIFVPTGLLVGLVIGSAGLYADWQAGRDVRRNTYVSATGPIEVIGSRYGYRLYVGDLGMWTTKPIADKLNGLTRGSIAFTHHGRLILEARDDRGRVVYRDSALATAVPEGVS